MIDLRETRNGWKRLFVLADDLGEWIELLEREARDDSEPIWGSFDTKKIIELVEKLFQEFEECLKADRDKIDKSEIDKEGMKILQKIRTETQETLDSFRKEY